MPSEKCGGPSPSVSPTDPTGMKQTIAYRPGSARFHDVVSVPPGIANTAFTGVILVKISSSGRSTISSKVSVVASLGRKVKI
jgi:hypothetical protein